MLYYFLVALFAGFCNIVQLTTSWNLPVYNAGFAGKSWCQRCQRRSCKYINLFATYMRARPFRAALWVKYIQIRETNKMSSHLSSWFHNNFFLTCTDFCFCTVLRLGILCEIVSIVHTEWIFTVSQCKLAQEECVTLTHSAWVKRSKLCIYIPLLSFKSKMCFYVN